MNIGFVVAADRHTGAAAVAELMCRAVRSAGAEGRLLFRRGRNLEHRLRGVDWAHPELVKERSPADLYRNLGTVRRFARNLDAVVCHLPHDHALCAAAAVDRTTTVVRSYRHSKHVRRSLWHRWLSGRVCGALLAHSEMSAAGQFAGLRTLVVPVPVEDRFHRGVTPGHWRERLGIPDSSTLLGIVGKVSPGRGFERAIETVRQIDGEPHLVAVGHGESLADLRHSASEAGLGERVQWLGYRDGELPGLYAAMDLVLFTAAGSDHGHRAISEAQACGRAVVAAWIDGVGDLVEHGVTGWLVEPGPVELAAAVTGPLADRDRRIAIGRAAAAAVETRRMAIVGSRLVEFLARLVDSPTRV
jgi:glycosyltransferase involved in cell wall biosynthesis